MTYALLLTWALLTPTQMPTALADTIAVVQRERWLMGTILRVRVKAADRETAIESAGAALNEVARLERLLSTWDPASGMSAVNESKPGTPVRPDRELFGLLREAESWAARTGRAFDPEVGPLVSAWDLRGSGRIPSPAEIEQALTASRGRGFDIDPETATITRTHQRAWMDTGGFGKGAALRAARSVLKGHGIQHALLDFGGQILVMGNGVDHGDGGFIAVAHPVHRDEAACWLRLADASAATSGASERYQLVNGEELGHILDPRSGRPVRSWGSVAVVAADPLAADALSTALFVMGPEQGLAWARSLSDVGVLFLETNEERLRPRWNAAMERWLVAAEKPCQHTFQTRSELEESHR